jgi:hypothetical protein
MDTYTLFQVSDIGSTAHTALAEGGPMRLVGLSSRGAYLQTASKWMVYLSSEACRGPLTLNLPDAIKFFQSLEPGMSFQPAPGRPGIASASAILTYEEAQIWQAPPLPEILPLKDKILRRIERGLAFAAGIQPNRLQDNSSLRRQQPGNYFSHTGLEQSLENQLGLGEGLTPAGDDLLIGFLLALNRWGGAIRPDYEAGELSGRLVALAYRRTTTLSANLIECASCGQADERLIQALDSLACGKPELKKSLNALAGWGNSSGFAALDGMALGLKSLIQGE